MNSDEESFCMDQDKKKKNANNWKSHEFKILSMFILLVKKYI